MTVDDLGSVADASGGVLGAPLVRRRGCYGDDVGNSDSSPK